jgi:hypothetical protein
VRIPSSISRVAKSLTSPESLMTLRKIKISADKNLLSKVMTKVKNEKLIISVIKWPQDTDPPKITITIEEISELTSDGASHIKSKNAIRADSRKYKV